MKQDQDAKDYQAMLEMAEIAAENTESERSCAKLSRDMAEMIDGEAANDGYGVFTSPRRTVNSQPDAPIKYRALITKAADGNPTPKAAVTLEYLTPLEMWKVTKLYQRMTRQRQRAEKTE